MTTATQEDLQKNRIPLGWRDGCSGLLVPLNTCRQRNCYLPWTCEDERHAYEKCQYEDYMRRMKLLSKQNAAAAAASSALD